jgi:hypothetical protein
MPESTLHINRLINEKSPYLQQHARNPLTGFHGMMKLLSWQKEKTNRFSFLSVIPRVTGAM